MADDATVAAPEPLELAENPSSAPNKRRRLDPDLTRVAEIVMVLAAMGHMRGGRDPSPAEKSLAAEARLRLVSMCESLRPNDLFTSEAARVIAGDLGFSRQMGTRPSRKVSIADKVAITKKKMSEAKEFLVQSSPTYTVTYTQAEGVAGRTDHRVVTQQPAAQRAFAEKPNPNPQFSSGFQTVSPVGHSAPAGSNTTWKQMPFGEVQHQSAAQMRMPGGSLGKDSTSPLASVRVEPVQFRSELRPSGSAPTVQVQATSPANHLPEKSGSVSSMVSTFTTIKSPANIPVKPEVQTPVKVESSQAVHLSQKPIEDQNTRTTTRQVVKRNAFTAEHFSQSVNVVTSHVGNSIEIAKSIQKFLQRMSIDPSQNLPSVDYMSHSLNCQFCKISITDVESLLVCDACEKGIHLRCLKSLNQKALPDQDWHCPRCLLASNGKILPPKYGKVTKITVASKPSSSEKRPDIPDSKGSHQKFITGVKTRSSHQAHIQNVNNNSLEQTRDVPIVKENDVQSGDISSNSVPSEMGSLLDKESCTDRTYEKDSSVYDLSGTTSGIEDEHSHRCKMSAGLISCSLKGSDFESASDLGAESTPGSEDMPTVCGTVSDHSEKAAITQIDDGARLPLNSASMDSSDHESFSCTDKEPLNVSLLEGICEEKVAEDIKKEFFFSSAYLDTSNPENVQLTDKNRSDKSGGEVIDQLVANDMVEGIGDTLPTISAITECGDGANDYKLHSLRDLHNVEWVGEAIQTADHKIYYQSCRINNVMYNLQDHVLLPADNCKFSTSKLQALWEDVGDGSKWATMNRYYFPNDISEGVIRPSTLMGKNEVYETNDSYTVEAGKMHGPCLVVSLMNITKESEMQAYLAEKNNATCPIFFCRWFYDKTNGLFQPISC